MQDIVRRLTQTYQFQINFSFQYVKTVLDQRGSVCVDVARFALIAVTIHEIKSHVWHTPRETGTCEKEIVRDFFVGDGNNIPSAT